MKEQLIFKLRGEKKDDFIHLFGNNYFSHGGSQNYYLKLKLNHLM